ncbi:AMP-dependent synthetase and ligase [Gemmatirosa kalamazoonensis]|uniref:AMP-dependent synthetase and ligase n=1 Tax=Gemmatirosa kalamazoonensis TaxID=861299 RepID=W0RE31_9BACT|nr:AMP-binding protein [Gemmatirosa kalamazoonensis]AHG89349.1 AMP-dependent synthetase and ligase [Gemmatirosa kalamazoonensis]
MNVAELLAGPVAERPDAPALVERVGGRTRATTFAALDAAARATAALLVARGVRAGDAVLFFAPPSVELYAALAAVFRVGAVAMFVEPSAGRGVLDAACAMWPPAALVASRKAHLLRLVSRAIRRIPVKLVTRGWVPSAARLPLGGADAPLHPCDADAPALLTFTSGSTGTPKAAVRTHGILRAQLDALRPLAARAGERELVSLPIVVLVNLAAGATTVLPDADLRRPGAIDPAPVLAQLAEHDVGRVTASPAFLERLVDASTDGALARLASVVTGGGPVFPDLVARVKRAARDARIVAVYGSTEAEPIAHVRDDELSPDDHAATRAGRGLLAGTPDACVSLRIIHARPDAPLGPLGAAELEALRCAPGEPGEIVVAGAHVVRGYLRGIGDAETKVRVDDVVWHRTGDAGYLDERGRLWLLGRAAAAIVDARGTLYPFAAEAAARAMLGPRRVAVVAHHGRRVLVVERGADVDVPTLLGALSWAHLDDVASVDTMPTDRRHNAKIDYAAVRAMLR